MRRALRHVFFPLMIGTALLPWVVPERVELPTAVFLGSIVVIWCVEQLIPVNPEWNYRLLAPDLARASLGWRRLARDVVYAVFITLLSTLLLSVVAAHVTVHVPRVFDVWPHEAPFAARVGLAFIAVELFSYWFHRLAHRVPFFWRFHQTHHVVSELTSLKAVRTHPIDNVFFYVCRHVPLLAVGAEARELAAAVSFGATLSLLSHANVDVPEGLLRWLVNYPRYHAVHHAADIAKSNTNFGCHTIVFDRLFGTFDGGDDRPTGERQLGVSPLRPRTLWEELIAPPRA